MAGKTLTSSAVSIHFVGSFEGRGHVLAFPFSVERQSFHRRFSPFFCREIEATEHVRAWQEELCSRLNLTGKVSASTTGSLAHIVLVKWLGHSTGRNFQIRVAKEGLNATVGGSHDETKLYMEAVTAHPLFDDMTAEDFKAGSFGVALLGEDEVTLANPGVTGQEHDQEHRTTTLFGRAVVLKFQDHTTMSENITLVLWSCYTGHLFALKNLKDRCDSLQESEGGSDSFGDGLKVGVHGEVVPMGVDPAEVSFSHAGQYVLTK